VVLVRVLGSISVESDQGGPVTLSPKLKALLAVLVAHRDTTVSIDRLCDALWGDDQPDSAVVTLQSHLSRLRRLLTPAIEITAVDRGYHAILPAGTLDVDRFLALVARAEAADEPCWAARHYGDALAWWRGDAFGDVGDEEWVRSAAARASGSPTALAQAAYALGLALESTEPDESLRLLRDASATAFAAGNRWIGAFAATEVWWLEARRGDPRRALASSVSVIDTWHRGGDWVNLMLSLRHVVGIFEQVGDHDAAAVLHGAISAAGADLAMPFEPSDAQHLSEVVDRLRLHLGPVAFVQAVARGAALPDDGLVAFVEQRIAEII
jgi:hypothetical protein